MSNIVKGRHGEKLAKKFLVKNGYKIVATNYTNKIGEIDIIAIKNKTIVFVEVKHRTSLEFGHPREAVTSYKQNKIKQVAMLYLQSTNNLNEKIRFDVLDVLNNEITHIVNAF